MSDRLIGRLNPQSFLPTPEQQLLLNACLLDGEDAIASWRLWRAQVNFDHIDLGSIRLLPLLADNLNRLNVKDPSFGIYRGVKRRTWARNQMLYSGAATIVGRLQAAGISVLALKGMVLALSYYKQMSLRPMGDVDVLVKRNDRVKALDQLERLGWRLQSPQRPRDAADFAIRHACAFEDPSNSEVSVDLHWRLLWMQDSEDAEAALWSRAVALEFDRTHCLAPCAADMLIHVCAHGARWNDFPPLRWIVDALLLLRSHNVDWTYLREQSARLRLDLQLADSLTYLHDVMRAPIPREILADLANSEARPIERLLYQAELHPPEKRSLVTALRIHWHIARQQLSRSEGIYGYWRYFVALCAGRSVREIAGWTRRKLIDGVR